MKNKISPNQCFTTVALIALLFGQILTIQQNEHLLAKVEGMQTIEAPRNLKAETSLSDVLAELQTIKSILTQDQLLSQNVYPLLSSAQLQTYLPEKLTTWKNLPYKKPQFDC